MERPRPMSRLQVAKDFVARQRLALTAAVVLPLTACTTAVVNYGSMHYNSDGSAYREMYDPQRGGVRDGREVYNCKWHSDTRNYSLEISYQDLNGKEVNHHSRNNSICDDGRLTSPEESNQ